MDNILFFLAGFIVGAACLTLQFMFQYRGEDEEADEFIGFVTDSVERMKQQMQDLLAFTRAGKKGKAFEVYSH